MLRQELDGILMFINEATLNDTEWRQIKSMIGGSETEDPSEHSFSELSFSDINHSKDELKNKYQALYVCLKERSGEGNSAQRLTGYFIAKGVIDPRVIDPRIIDPRIIDPRVTDPRVTDPRVIDPRVFDSDGKSDLCNIIVGGVLE